MNNTRETQEDKCSNKKIPSSTGFEIDAMLEMVLGTCTSLLS